MKVLTSENDNILYQKLLELLYAIKITQGGTALSSTLRRHPKVKDYLISKQRNILEDIEGRYFFDNGELDQDQLLKLHQRSLQNFQNNVH